MNNSRELNIKDEISLNDNNKGIPVRGHVLLRDAETKEIIHEADNLVLMRTRVWLFEQLFKKNPPSDYTTNINNNRYIALFSIGSGGADVNATPFSPYVPKFSDTQLGTPIPFVTVDPDKANNTESQSNPSVLTSISTEQRKIYYMPHTNEDGTIPYYAKRFDGATDQNPFGSSAGWSINQYNGEVSFSLKLSVSPSEARGSMFNEIGLWIGAFNSGTNTYNNLELATRFTFSTESTASLSKGIEIEYTMYI